MSDSKIGWHAGKEPESAGGIDIPSLMYANGYNAAKKELRDQFAMHALASMLTEPIRIKEGTYELAAELAYKFADAMLAEREKKNE